MNLPERCDVVVIGGGPGGSTAATQLAQKGYDVVLVDKERHPRYTVGESLIPHFWKFCEMTGSADRLAAEGFVPKVGGTVVWNGVIRQMAFRDFGYTRPALHVERDRFDHLLLEYAKAAGARVLERVAALTVDLGDSSRAVHVRAAGDDTVHRIGCRFVVDASGQNAVLAKQLGTRVIDDSFRFMSIWGYFRNSKYVGVGGTVHRFEELVNTPPTTFVCSVDELGEWGWLWHIPLRKTTSVGLVLPQSMVQAIKSSDQALEGYFLKLCREVPYLNRLLEGAEYEEGSFHAIRDYSYRNLSLAGPGFFLVGDAGVFVDPIFSVGVVFAMYTAHAAVWAIDRTFRDPSAAERHIRIFASQCASRIEVSRALALPRYTSRESFGEETVTAMRFESSLEKELMYVASSLTTRNQNFQEMVRDRTQTVSDKFRVLETIHF